MTSGEQDLKRLLASMSPSLDDEFYVFCTLLKGQYGDYGQAEPIASFVEDEGLTLVLKQQEADRYALNYSGVFSRITLTVHSSLEAVGLTAAVSNALADQGISANVVAAFYHDHIFVPYTRAADALAALDLLTKS